MNNFIFCNPTKLIFGKDTIGNIGKELHKDNIKKVLMIYGKKSIFENGVYDTIKNSLNEFGIEAVEVSGVKANPVLSKVEEATKVAKENKVDAILCVGGGSVYDSSKAVAASYYYDGATWDFFEAKIPVEKALPIYGVLTLSATGSEMNCGGVITKEDEQKKWSFGSPLLYPRVSIVDPSIQCSLPKKQTVNGVIDTMTHVFELYFDGTKNVDIMDGYCEAIIRTAMKHGEILLADPTNYESRAELALSATLALNGTTKMARTNGDWSTHAMEHALSAIYDISHGAGLAIIFPAWAKYVYKEDLDTFSNFAERIFNITEGTKEEKALKGIEKLQEFYKKIGAPTSLKDINVGEDDISAIAKNIARVCPLGTLKVLEENDVLEILKLAL